MQRIVQFVLNISIVMILLLHLMATSTIHFALVVIAKNSISVMLTFVMKNLVCIGGCHLDLMNY